ncbi:MAG TPA: SDR family NAD(P)-dependent oxidoreductase [Candidatus Sulfotelmatobacter sp.]|nr:SDR family NAD(P)-dependent oxidoreductase [Candidatus Sulfotelmatobacter sp.]
MNKIDLEGRHAIVTGGARGIGYAIAERLLASGAAVTLWDVDREALDKAIAALGEHGKVGGDSADVTREASIAGALAATLKRGPVDILINNAGIAGPNRKTWEYDPADWRRVIEIDLIGVYLCCRAVVPGMIERGYGRIVNIASVAGKEGNPNASAYSAAKAGVIGLTKSLGKELAQTGVRVNCVTPATFKSPILAQLPQSQIDYMKSKIPMGRLGEVDEVAALVCWLASEECSFSTAATFDISGGRTTY